MLALALSACAAPTPYGPLAVGDGYGYSAQRIEGNRFRVTFAGNAATPREVVRDYLLYRAAELTLEEGADYFIITARSMVPETFGDRDGTRVGIGIGGSGGSSSGLSIGTGISLGLGRGPDGPSTASAEIVIHSGEKPDAMPDAFDARAVQRNIAPRIARPGSS